MKKILMIIRVMLSGKFVLVTATGKEDSQYLAFPYNMDDSEFRNLCEMEWEDIR